jgi:hypothetical protein
MPLKIVGEHGDELERSCSVVLDRVFLRLLEITCLGDRYDGSITMKEFVYTFYRLAKLCVTCTSQNMSIGRCHLYIC